MVVRSDTVVIYQDRMFLVLWQDVVICQLVVVVRQEGKSDGEPASASAAAGR